MNCHQWDGFDLRAFKGRSSNGLAGSLNHQKEQNKYNQLDISNSEKNILNHSSTCFKIELKHHKLNPWV